MSNTPTPTFPVDDLYLTAEDPSAAIAALFGADVTINRRRGVSGGSINRTEVLELSEREFGLSQAKQR